MDVAAPRYRWPVARRALVDDETAGRSDVRADALSVAELCGEVESVLTRAFPRTRVLWVRGEIQQITDRGAGRGHCYIDLVDPETAGASRAPVLKVKCWQPTWGPLRSVLARDGIVLAPGMVVVLRGRLAFYAPKAEVGFVLDELDVTALIGRLAAQRAELLRALGAEGLLERNKALEVAAVPLRVGLVASPDTEGCRDFLGQLLGSRFAFHVALARAVVQGGDAPASIVSALDQLFSLGVDALDLVVLVRGGGSKSDLAAFDAEVVARAIARAPVPVWCGVGHTGDESVADLVANRTFITPTACGQELVARVSAWWTSRVEQTRTTVLVRAADAVATGERAHATSRTRLAAMARHVVTGQRELLSRRGSSVRRCALRAGEAARVDLAGTGARVAPLARAQISRAERSVESWRRLVSAYDVDRQLRRGYTLTFDGAGRLLRGAGDLRPGTGIVTRFSDGEARSVVDGVDPRDPSRGPAPARDGARAAPGGHGSHERNGEREP